MNDAKCVDCADWFGRCVSEKRVKYQRLNRLASSDACGDFKDRRERVCPLQEVLS
jgi:hypothetical protein